MASAEYLSMYSYTAQGILEALLIVNNLLI